MSTYVPILQEHVRGTRFDLEQLVDCAGELSMTLTSTDGHRLELKFDSYLAYRKLDEGDALLMLSAMRNSGGTNRCLYRVDDSDFLAWFNTERCNQTLGSQQLDHYAIATMNDIVDVLALDAPVVEAKRQY
jgi:hypothetical protein